MNPSSQPYQPGELPPVPPAFPGDAAAASLTAEQVQALRNRNYLRADSYTRADSYGRQDSGLSFYEYQIGDGDESQKPGPTHATRRVHPHDLPRGQPPE